MKTLSLVIPTLNQVQLSKTCYKEIFANTIGEVEFIILDNGSDLPIQEIDFPKAKIVRNEKNIGVYPTVKQGFEVATGDVVAFFHSDVVVWEKGWNLRVIDIFEKHEKLGLMGFIGSNEIDSSGGRGCGTTSQFQGRELTDGIKTWKGSRWDAHGTFLNGFIKGAVVDGCTMILNRDCWNRMTYRENFPLHHFYDRLLCTQTLELGYDVGILGIEFDHFSGQTVGHEVKYDMSAERWCNDNLSITTMNEWKENNEDWYNNPTNPSRFGSLHNWDSVIYMEAEQRFLKEYRDEKHIVPIKI